MAPPGQELICPLADQGWGAEREAGSAVPVSAVPNYGQTQETSLSIAEYLVLRASLVTPHIHGDQLFVQAVLVKLVRLLAMVN